MRIHSLNIEGFGPFKDPQLIDFDALSQDKIFMLEGPTGAGKSSIIDAIVYALYGMTAHEAATKGGPSGNRVRSDYCEPEAETRVSMEFTTGGARYRISRVAPYDAPKKSGEGTRLINAKATLEFINPVREAITQVREVNIRISEELQMDHEQFSQMVVLPQGDFASFLHASTEKRREVLESIFKTYFYDGIKGNLDAKEKQIRSELALHTQEITRHVKNLQDESAAATGEMNFEELESVLLDSNLGRLEKDQTLESVISALRPDSVADLDAKENIEKELEPLRVRLKTLQESEAQIEAKRQLDLELSRLGEVEAQIVHLESQVELHAKIRPLATLMESRDAAYAEMEAALELIPVAYAEMTAAEVRARIKVLNKEVGVLLKKSLEAGAAAEKVEQLEAQILNSTEIEEAIATLPKITKNVENLQARSKVIESKISDFRRLQKESSALEVAKLLKAGFPCPVCGSTEHPAPLKGEALDETELEELSSELEDIREKLIQERTDLLTATTRSKKVHKSVVELTTELRASESKAEQSDDLSEQYEGAQEELDDLNESQDYFTEYEKAEKTVVATQGKIDSELKKLGIDDDQAISTLELDLESIKVEVEEHRGRIKEIRALLGQEIYKTLPDEEKLAEEIGRITSEVALLTETLSEIVDRLAVLSRINAKIDSAAAGITNSLDHVARILIEGKPYLSLHDWVSAKNPAGLSLTNFVLQERLGMILEYASRHLRRISNGKYEFRLFEEKVGRNQKAGLGITVMDYFAGKERPAETLSGGETFYASLALALGLVEVVKADNGGIELGTLFIDEGFGSLSDDTLEEVIDVLEELRAERIIGIISHVEGMKTQIPMRLEVRPSADGPSFVRMAAAGLN